MYFTKAFLVASGLAGLSEAHMVLRNPAPYASPAVINSPLEPDGSNYPCQAKAGASFSGAATTMAKGTTQKMSFTGTAVHGGGSCQISITYDAQPNKQSVFKVIHSIEGGCPARNVAGNAGNDPNAPAPDEYPFKIPDGIPNGKATLAWSWLNRIGNREFYMNCAPIEITGAEGSEATLAALPDMLIANIDPTGSGQGAKCTTEENFDVKYPAAGDSVEPNGSNTKLPLGNCGSAVAGNSTNSAAARPSATPAVRGRRPFQA